MRSHFLAPSIKESPMNVMRFLGSTFLALLACVSTAQAQVCYRGEPVTVIVDSTPRSGARLICDGRDVGVDLDPVVLSTRRPSVWDRPDADYNRYQIAPPVMYYVPPPPVSVAPSRLYLGRNGVEFSIGAPGFRVDLGYNNRHGHRHHNDHDRRRDNHRDNWHHRYP